MKRNITIIVLMFAAVYAFAQEPSAGIKSVFDACRSMRSAINSGDIDGLRQANIKLKDCETAPFNHLIAASKIGAPTLDGHFVFETEFVDSLIEMGKLAVYKYAQRYAGRGAMRGTSPISNVYLKTIAIPEKSTTVYTYRGNDHMELAVVTEPGGLVSLKVINLETDAVYKNYDEEKTGQPSRFISFDLPNDSNTGLEVQITNCSAQIISCVIISN